tara:strand:- start:610 stop:1473 length:864 start_codon:yes stop_codon:yes gene_type:complete
MAITEECREFLDSHFKLENYADVVCYDLTNWYSQFAYRQRDQNPDVGQLVAAPLAQTNIFDDPHVTSKSFGIKDWEAVDYYCAKFSIRNNLEAINKEFKEAGEFVDSHIIKVKCGLKRERIVSQFIESQADANSGHYANSTAKIFDKSVEYSIPKMDPDIKVNLFHSDKALKKFFSEWLQNKRQMLGDYSNLAGASKSFGRDRIKTWQKKVLPYIDLISITRHYGCKTTYADLYPYLFKDEIDKKISSDFVDKIRRSIKPEVDRMLDPDVLISLGMAAQFERHQFDN